MLVLSAGLAEPLRLTANVSFDFEPFKVNVFLSDADPHKRFAIDRDIKPHLDWALGVDTPRLTTLKFSASLRMVAGFEVKVLSELEDETEEAIDKQGQEAYKGVVDAGTDSGADAGTDSGADAASDAGSGSKLRARSARNVESRLASRANRTSMGIATASPLERRRLLKPGFSRMPFLIFIDIVKVTATLSFEDAPCPGMTDSHSLHWDTELSTNVGAAIDLHITTNLDPSPFWPLWSKTWRTFPHFCHSFGHEGDASSHLLQALRSRHLTIASGHK